METKIRKSSIESLGLGSVYSIFQNGKLPIATNELIDKVFGPEGKRGAMVVSGANGIVGAGKVMQFASRLLPYNVPVIALDMPGSPNGIAKQYNGLVKAFGKDGANAIMNNVIQMTYDGNSLPDRLKQYNPKFLLEAIPEKLELKKEHYKLFKKEFPKIKMWSVTSGFPSSQLGVGIAHPAFPHEINKVFEVVETKVSDETKLLWSLGLIPIQVSDDWSFVLDVFFCGLLLAGVRYHELTNMPYWKIDKYVRQLVGPNPFRAHDAIGAKGANFLTWSCLHHLSLEYGPLFAPTSRLIEKKDSGANWYPMDHFRPLVNWSLDSDEDKKMLETMIFGPLFQMTSIMIHEKRASLSSMNSIGELCAQFTRGIPSLIRSKGYDDVVKMVKAYHKLDPEAAKTKWYPEVFKNMDTPEWKQLYVNAEHDGTVGVISISRESYNSDVNAELNQAIDWLKKNKIKRVILTSDFHLSTQMVGADTNDFFPALSDVKAGERIAATWSATARRLYNEFDVSVGVINGKRCMGGMLELMMHCHYMLAFDDTVFSMPEVKLPVVPGMEGCHWAIRKLKANDAKKIISMLMDGSQVKAKDCQGWLIDFAGAPEKVLKKAWQLVKSGEKVMPIRKVNDKPIKNLPLKDVKLNKTNEFTAAAQKAILDCVISSCGASLNEALKIQAKHSAEFMISKWCNKGKIGTEYSKIMSN